MSAGRRNLAITKRVLSEELDPVEGDVIVYQVTVENRTDEAVTGTFSDWIIDDLFSSVNVTDSLGYDNTTVSPNEHDVELAGIVVPADGLYGVRIEATVGALTDAGRTFTNVASFLPDATVEDPFPDAIWARSKTFYFGTERVIHDPVHGIPGDETVVAGFLNFNEWEWYRAIDAINGDKAGIFGLPRAPFAGPPGPPGADGAAGPPGPGDMNASDYDPTGIVDDAFDRAHHYGTFPGATLPAGAALEWSLAERVLTSKSGFTAAVVVPTEAMPEGPAIRLGARFYIIAKEEPVTFDTTGITFGSAYTPTVIPLGGWVTLVRVAADLWWAWGSESLGGGGTGDMTALMYDPATIEEQLVGLTAIQTLTNKTLDSFSNNLSADEIHLQGRNESGGLLVKGTPVYDSGYSVGSEIILFDAADASSAATMQCVGLIEADIANNATGSIVTAGRIINVDTSAWSAGDTLYVSETAGVLTNVAPTGAALVQVVGHVQRSHATFGVLDINLSQTVKSGYIHTLLDDADAAGAQTTLGLDTTVSRVAALDKALNWQGFWDASSGVFPGAGAAIEGDVYHVNVAGTQDGVAFAIDDRIMAVADTASTTTYAANWLKLDNAYATTFARTILDDADAATARTTLGVSSPLFILPCSDLTTAIDTIGTDVGYFRAPFAFTLDDVVITLLSGTTTGVVTVDVNEGGVSVLSTKLTIDATETSSETAATPAVISDSAIASGAIVGVDLDTVGDGTATGLQLTVYGTPT